jgi:predicted transcriptional regulator
MPKYTIELGADYDKRLAQMANRKQMTKADIVRRALATYVIVDGETLNGNKLAITDPSGKVVKELVTA